MAPLTDPLLTILLALDPTRRPELRSSLAPGRARHTRRLGDGCPRRAGILNGWGARLPVRPLSDAKEVSLQSLREAAKSEHAEVPDSTTWPHLYSPSPGAQCRSLSADAGVCTTVRSIRCLAQGSPERSLRRQPRCTLEGNMYERCLRNGRPGQGRSRLERLARLLHRPAPATARRAAPSL